MAPTPAACQLSARGLRGPARALGGIFSLPIPSGRCPPPSSASEGKSLDEQCGAETPAPSALSESWQGFCNKVPACEPVWTAAGPPFAPATPIRQS